MDLAITNYRDLQAWREGMTLVTTIYRLAQKLPDTEKFGLVTQMCRAAVSVPANTAEGHGSSYRNVFLNHLSMAHASLMELETHVLLTQRLEFLTIPETQSALKHAQKVGKLINGLIRALKTGSASRPLTPDP